MHLVGYIRREVGVIPILSSDRLIFKGILEFPPIAIARGKTTFITGRSGSGKSTLFKLFNGIHSPDTGEVYYEGKAISKLDTIALRREVLLVSQGVFLFAGTIKENFAAFYDYRELPAISDTEMVRFLQLCCADFPLDASCNTMSGGERQRIYLAICLSLKPNILMLDEPTSALDGETADRLLQRLCKFAQETGMTLLIISHDPALAAKYGDQIIDLEQEDKR